MAMLDWCRNKLQAAECEACGLLQSLMDYSLLVTKCWFWIWL